MKSQGANLVTRRRGRPPGDSDTRGSILEAARRQFAEHGYQRTTMRSVAAAAGVDPRLVAHYFGSKAGLFRASVVLPVDPDQLIERLFDAAPADIPHLAATLLVGMLEDATTRRAFVSLLRAAVAEPEAATQIREVLAERILLPVASRVGGPDPELRASLMSTLLVGLAVSRHIVGFKALAAMPPGELANVIAPVIEHYLLGDWVARRPGPAAAG